VSGTSDFRIHTPGQVTGLIWVDDPVAGVQFLSWSLPGVPGGSTLVYDTLRTSDSLNFLTGTTCVESDDGIDQTAFDFAAPGAGQAFHYLVRAENACPLGDGPLGNWSNAVLRAGRTCP
jgi:hypothetical protein